MPVPYWHQQQTANANANGGNHRPPFSPLTVSKVNTGVCDVKLDSTGSMCGTVYRDQPSLQCYLRDAHPGAASSPTRVNITIIEKLQGENVLKTWVLTGGWRDARYVKEPGRGPEGGLIAQYANACELIAREDADFRRKIGENSHSRIRHENPGFQPGRQSRSRARQFEAEAEAAAPQSQRDGPGRIAWPSPRRRSQTRVLYEQGQDSVLVSDCDEVGAVSVKSEGSP